MGIVLTSTVIAAIVSAIVTLLAAERRIAAENVIQERQKWRDIIRPLSVDIFDTLIKRDTRDLEKLRILRSKLSLHLNPHDLQDQMILELVQLDQALRADEFMVRIALLLKHDWERAKREASLWRRFWERPPGRVDFEDYDPDREHRYRMDRYPAVSAIREVDRSA